jgi:hypothetical protein
MALTEKGFWFEIRDQRFPWGRSHGPREAWWSQSDTGGGCQTKRGANSRRARAALRSRKHGMSAKASMLVAGFEKVHGEWR